MTWRWVTLLVVVGLGACARPSPRFDLPQGKDSLSLHAWRLDLKTLEITGGVVKVDRSSSLARYGEDKTTGSLRLTSQGEVVVSGSHELDKKTTASVWQMFFSFLAGLWAEAKLAGG